MHRAAARQRRKRCGACLLLNKSHANLPSPVLVRVSALCLGVKVVSQWCHLCCLNPPMPPVRLTLRLPADLSAELTAQAQACGVSLNAWLILAARNWAAYKRRELGPAAAPPLPKAPPTPAKAVSGMESWPKVGRNDPCPCGSGRKWKVCHGKP